MRRPSGPDQLPLSSIFISVNKSDTLEKSPIDKAVTRVAVALARQRQQGAIPSGPGLEITFLLASPDLQPDFEGMRTIFAISISSISVFIWHRSRGIGARTSGSAADRTGRSDHAVCPAPPVHRPG
ncbi:MAG: hypothetical protein WBC62_10455 [Candidatus Macondimonas sp.]